MLPVAHLWTPVELQTEILPYTGVMSAVTLKNPAQVSLLQTMTQFSTGHYYRYATHQVIFKGDNFTQILPAITTDISCPVDEIIITLCAY